MKLSTMLFAMAGLIGTGILVERRRQRRALAPAGGLGSRTGALGAHIRDAELVGSGISSVDPEPLAQTAGEGIDRDAVAAAHHGAPAPRKNVP